MDPISSRRTTFASFMFLRDKVEHGHFLDITAKLQRPSNLLDEKKYSSAGRQFLIIWQDVQTRKQNLYSDSNFVLWNLEMATNNEASILIKELEELGINLIRDGAMTFFLAEDEPFKEENIHRYPKGDKKRANEPSPWPKFGSEMKVDNKCITKGIGIDLVLDDIKHPLDILLERCTTNRDVADYLSYYYFLKRGALNIEGYYSADIECIMGQSPRIGKEAKLGLLKHALQRASGHSDIGHEEWIEACIKR